VARWVQHAAADRVLGYLHEALAQPPRERMENLLLVGESNQATWCLPPYVIAVPELPGEGRLGPGAFH
jgi:hypothetical protein